MWQFPCRCDSSPPQPHQHSEISQLFASVLGYFYPFCWLWDGCFQSVLYCPPGNFLLHVLMMSFSLLLSISFPYLNIGFWGFLFIYFFVLWWAGFSMLCTNPTELITSDFFPQGFKKINWRIDFFIHVYNTFWWRHSTLSFPSSASPSLSQKIFLLLYLLCFVIHWV